MPRNNLSLSRNSSMDSGHSGSVQSSSGGDDQEFDSRGGGGGGEFFNASNFGSISGVAPPQQFLSQQNPNFFDPQSLDHGGGGGRYSTTNDNDLIWSRGLRSDGNAFSNLGVPPPSFPGVTSADSGAPPQAARNPRKRTRASRRAPTTVLTTDTTNFRQMVQEFTGIPAAPFSGSSPYSRRHDLFSAASHLNSLGPLYPLRPSAHKILSPFSPSPPPPLTSTMIDAIVPSTTITNPNNNNNLASSPSTSINPNNFQLLNNFQPSLQLGATSPMNFSNLSAFLSRDGAASTSTSAAQMNGSDTLSRWKNVEQTARNIDVIRENQMEFNANNMNIDEIESQNQNLNLREKGMENAASSIAEGTVASWISPSNN